MLPRDRSSSRSSVFSDSKRVMVEIGDKAFYGCEDIEYIHLPATFRSFGAQSFRGCESLKYVYCDGGMPRFNDSCLWTGNYIAVFYPTNNPWPWDYQPPISALFFQFILIIKQLGHRQIVNHLRLLLK